MSCAIASAEDLHLDEFQVDPLIVKKSAETNVISLPRGGLIIQTPIGNIQLGMPPDTVKDSICMGIEIPEYYIVPSRKFDSRVCLNVSEFEFPAYFNFFVRKKQISLICTADQEKKIRAVFQETLLGPVDHEVLCLFIW
jgi:hypothetical protein